MNTKSKMLVALSIIAALCIGFLVGVNVNSTKVNKSSISGTMGKDKHKTCTSPQANSASCQSCHD